MQSAPGVCKVAGPARPSRSHQPLLCTLRTSRPFSGSSDRSQVVMPCARCARVRKVARPDPPGQVTSVALVGFVDVATIFQGAETIKCGHGVYKVALEPTKPSAGSPHQVAEKPPSTPRRAGRNSDDLPAAPRARWANLTGCAGIDRSRLRLPVPAVGARLAHGTSTCRISRPAVITSRNWATSTSMSRWSAGPRIRRPAPRSARRPRTPRNGTRSPSSSTAARPWSSR